MNLVSAQTILDGAGIAMAWDLEQLETRQEQMRREAFSLALQELWQAWWWELLMVCQPLPGATQYTGTTAFVAQEFCYFPGTQKYYQALGATTGNAPALYVNGGWTTNTAFWADAKARMDAPDFVVGQNDTGLLIGAQVRNPLDGLYYQLYRYSQFVIVAGAGNDSVNGTYNGVGTGIYAMGIYSFQFQSQGGAGSVFTAFSLTDTGNNYYYAQAEQQFSNVTQTGSVATITNPAFTLASGDLDNFGNLLTGVLPCPTVTQSPVYNAVPDPANWAQVIPFAPTVAVQGTARSATMTDPRGSLAPRPYNFQKSGEGVEIFGLTHGAPWFWYRRPTPIVTGDDFDPTAEYEATPADQLVYDS